MERRVRPAREFGRLSGVLDGWCERQPARSEERASARVNLTFNLATDAKGVAAESERLKKDWGAAATRIAGGALLGTPAQATDRILEYVAAGATEVNIALRAPWNADALDAYIEEVVPRVRAADEIAVRLCAASASANASTRSASAACRFSTSRPFNTATPLPARWASAQAATISRA